VDVSKRTRIEPSSLKLCPVGLPGRARPVTPDETTVAHEMDRKPTFFPLPFAAWHALACISEMLPSPPLTRNQVELMEIDNVARNDVPGFDRLNVAPRSVEEILPSILREVSSTFAH
jgi:hypothetical protein